ncbi:MAG TPA: phosphoribosylglycinamide formyltransferase [Gemmatimonadaceae bacterium]|jgi:formyltetrahydrofolate-dependent phosphoribosylglycinamide formyltransferase|nr:phosphoribosylglycinamide formyltransferase [Gemmatimonadaceae bacterium]
MAPRIAVLASGGGTNLQAIVDYFSELSSPSGTIQLVASNKSSAGALTRARNAGIAAESFDATDDGTALSTLLARWSIDLVVLAGYLKRIPSLVIDKYRGRIINIHPGLLPDFGGAGMYGQRVHAAVLASGATTTGLTVHFVDNEYDHGPVIAQWRLRVKIDDTTESLADRVLSAEHIVYPRVVEMVASLTGAGLAADF